MPLALLASAAQAQNVSVYGLVDLAVERLDHVGATAASLTRMPGLTGSFPSRLGLRGTEDLGGGLRAVLTLEMGIGLDTGTLNQGGRAWGRQAFVGLQGAWGSATFGRQYSMLFWSMLDSDILGPNAYGSGSLDSYLPNARADNSVAYRGTFGAVAIGATYSLGRDAVNAGPSPAGTRCPGESATDATTCKQGSAMVKYEAGRWGLSAAVDELRGGPGAFAGLTRSDMTDRRALLAGWVRSGDFKVGGGLISRKNDGSPATPQSRLWYLGAAYAVTPQFMLDGELYRLAYGHSANQATLVAVRALYAFSRRTAVYATAGQMSNGGTLAIPVSGAAPGGAPAAGVAQAGVAAGVRHAF